MSESEMVERVARASFAAWCKRMADTGQRAPDIANAKFEELSEREREFAFLHARAAILAMREPTEAMIEGASSYDDYGHPAICKAHWQAMIDRALSD